MSHYPVGAEWTYIDPNTEKRFRIWLKDRTNRKYEHWRAFWCYRDGSHPSDSGDWFTSYAAARRWFNEWSGYPSDGARFKRTK